MKRYVYILFCISVLRQFSQLAIAAESTATADPVALTAQWVNDLLTEARRHNSGIRAGEVRADAALVNINTVRRWDDPRFGISGVITTPRGGPMFEEGDFAYGMEQKLPLWKRPQLQQQIAVQEAQTAATEVESRAQFLRRDILRALVQMSFSARTTGFLTNDIAWLETLIALQEEKVRVGGAMSAHTELLLLQNERSRRADALRTEENRLRVEQASLNRVLNRELPSPWPKIELPRLLPPIKWSTDLAVLALQHEPRLKVMRQDQARAVAVTRLTETMGRPEVSLGLQGRHFSGDGGFRQAMLSVNFTLPLWNTEKYRTDLRRDQTKVRVIEAEIVDQEKSVLEAVHRLTLAIDDAWREAALYRDEIIQRYQQAVASHHAMWETRQGPLRDLLDSRRAHLDSLLQLDRATVAEHLAFIELAVICGAPDHWQLPKVLYERQMKTSHPKHTP